MGYYTDYELTFYGHTETNQEKIYEHVFEDEECTVLSIGDSTRKWYCHENDMKILSNKFPDVLFELDGYGEEQGDIWRKYFKNGKMQKSVGKITYEPFDEGKLK